MKSAREPRILRFAEWAYGWRLWAVIPLAVILFLVPMPDPVRILIGIVYAVVLVVPFVLRVVGNFVAGYRGL